MKHALRYSCTWLLANLLILLGLTKRAQTRCMRGDYISSIYFHKPSLNEFEECVKWLKKRGFKFLSIDNVCQIIELKQPLPHGAVILTVDDGWQSNKSNIADIAEKHQIPVTIFVSTAPVEQGTFWWSYVDAAKEKRLTKLSVEQLKKVPEAKRLKVVNDLKKHIKLPREAMTVIQIQQISASPWVTIGSHTHSHPILNNCTSEQVYLELDLAKKKLENWTKNKVNYFAYPNGDYTEREINILSDLGYKLAFTVRPHYLSSDRLQDRYELPRFEVIENAPFAETVCRMMGIWEPTMHRIRKIYLRNPIFSKLTKLQNLFQPVNEEMVST